MSNSSSVTEIGWVGMGGGGGRGSDIFLVVVGLGTDNFLPSDSAKGVGGRIGFLNR